MNRYKIPKPDLGTIQTLNQWQQEAIDAERRRPLVRLGQGEYAHDIHEDDLTPDSILWHIISPLIWLAVVLIVSAVVVGVMGWL